MEKSEPIQPIHAWRYCRSAADNTTVLKLQRSPQEHMQLGWIPDILMNESQRSIILSCLRWELSKRKIQKNNNPQLSSNTINTKLCHQKKKKTQISSEITSDIFHTWLFPAFPIWEQRKTQSSLLIIHMTLSDWDPRCSGGTDCCNQQMPRNMLVIWSTNEWVCGCAWLFPLAHVWHLGGGVLRRGGRNHWTHVGVGGCKTRWRRQSVQWQHRVFLQDVSKLIFTLFALPLSVFPKH